MTDTRKQIIELIEPYMDKTIDKGLYFYDRGDICNVAEIIGGDVIWIKAGNIKGVRKDLFGRFGFGREIIGHYDITAVLKYIDNLSFYFYPGAGFLDNLYFSLGEKEIEHKWQMDGKFFMIPNKPLHLYTEEEEKDLLELLKKLGSTNNSKEA